MSDSSTKCRPEKISNILQNVDTTEFQTFYKMSTRQNFQTFYRMSNLLGCSFLVTNIPLGAYLLRLGAHFEPSSLQIGVIYSFTFDFVLFHDQNGIAALTWSIIEHAFVLQSKVQPKAQKIWTKWELFVYIHTYIRIFMCMCILYCLWLGWRVCRCAFTWFAGSCPSRRSGKKVCSGTVRHTTYFFVPWGQFFKVG
jgi:hypothetical protein